MSPVQIINFFKEYGSTIIEYRFAFLTFAVLCIIATSAFWKRAFKKYQQQIDTLQKENLLLSEELERLKKQYGNLTIEGYIAASREEPTGIAAERISRRFQNGKEV